MGRQNYYDWYYQGAGGAPIEIQTKLLPGDELITHCYFDTTNSVREAERGGHLLLRDTDVTLYGDGTNEEMCFNFIAYFPRHPALQRCFGAMGAGVALDSSLGGEVGGGRRRLNGGGSGCEVGGAIHEACKAATQCFDTFCDTATGKPVCALFESHFDMSMIV